MKKDKDKITSNECIAAAGSSPQNSSFSSNELTKLAFVLFAFVGVASVAQAAFPGENGRIAFMSNRTGSYLIYSVKPNGGGVRQLTNLPNADSLPSWSADGQKIAFVSTRDGNNEIYMMDKDGNNQRRLTNNPASDDEPTWSPDGRTIVFDSRRVTASNPLGLRQLYLMDTLGAGCNTGNCPVRALPAPVRNGVTLGTNRPRFSPNGHQIAFRAATTGFSAIYVMNRNGKNIRQYTSADLLSEEPDWSPDGSKIVFDILPSTEIFNIVIGPAPDRHFDTPIDLNTPGVRLLTPGPAGSPFGLDGGQNYNPHFSPSGKLVLYEHNNCTNLSCDFNGDVFKTNIKGTRFAGVIVNGASPIVNAIDDTRIDWGPKANDDHGCDDQDDKMDD